MGPKFTQSYLLIGGRDDTQAKTVNIAQDLGISLAASSPDITIITPKSLPARSGLSPSGSKTGRQVSISIDQVRQLKKSIFEKPFTAYKLIIIRDAQTMTSSAQNALLKILEEPPPHAVIILEATAKEALTQTIRSRTVTIRVPAQKSDSNETPITLKNSNLLELLTHITTVQNPSHWLDAQISALYKNLLANLHKNQLLSSSRIAELIYEHAQAKQMVQNNVNPKFALFNLIFRTIL